MIGTGSIIIVQIPTQDKQADVLTKPLGPVPFRLALNNTASLFQTRNVLFHRMQREKVKNGCGEAHTAKPYSTYGQMVYFNLLFCTQPDIEMDRIVNKNDSFLCMAI